MACTNDAKRGEDIVLYANVGTDAAPNYQKVASQRSMDLSRTADVIDTSNKDSGANQRVIAGRKSSVISLDALYVPSASAFVTLRSKFDAREEITIRKYVDSVAVEEACAIINDMSESHPDNDVATISMELTIDNGWTAL